MIRRKPKIGKVICRPNGSVLGKVTHIENDICHLKSPDGGLDLFYWKFDEGPNNFYHIKEKQHK